MAQHWRQHQPANDACQQMWSGDFMFDKDAEIVGRSDQHCKPGDRDGAHRVSE
jgi:hypothetical protein